MKYVSGIKENVKLKHVPMLQMNIILDNNVQIFWRNALLEIIINVLRDCVKTL